MKLEAPHQAKWESANSVFQSLFRKSDEGEQIQSRAILGSGAYSRRWANCCAAATEKENRKWSEVERMATRNSTGMAADGSAVGVSDEQQKKHCRWAIIAS